MKLSILLILLATSSITKATDYDYINGYTRSNGTYVRSHYRSEANDTEYDNLNYGKSSSKSRYESSLGSGKTIFDN